MTASARPSDDVELTHVPWEDADAALLRDEQQAELAARYDGVGDIQHHLPPERVIATVLVRVDGAPAAIGTVRRLPELGDGVGELKRMYVRPAHRGQGLSRRILGVLERRAADAGLTRLVLETGNRQPEAIGLYRSAGYTPMPRYEPYVDEETSLCFTRELAAGSEPQDQPFSTT